MTSYKERLAQWQAARFAPPPEPDPVPTAPTLVEKVAMRDGIGLYTEVFLPAKDGRYPTVLCRSPYPYSRPSKNDRFATQQFLEAGFAVVFQLTRGQHSSEGVFRFFLDDIDDGYDSVEWVASQPWCDGNVGMQGVSYLAGTQLLAAKAKPAALKCIMPTAFLGNHFWELPFLRGIPQRGLLLQWYKVADTDSMAELDAPYGDMSLLQHPLWGPALQQRPLIDAAQGILTGDKLASWREVMTQTLDNDYWQPVHFTDKEMTALDLPIFFTDGWYDESIGPWNFFQRMEQLQPGKADRYLLVGPWNHPQTFHSSAQSSANGERLQPDNSCVDLVEQRLAFFNRYLRGDTSARVQEDRIKLYITGLDQWLHFSTFPVDAINNRQFYLHSQGNAHHFPEGGVLSTTAPDQEPADHYTYNPDFATPSETAPFCDRRELEIRADMLIYTSEPLAEPLTILGDMTMTLYAASSCKDTDWLVKVTEVFPDGRSIAFHGVTGALRARYRAGFDQEVLLEPNAPTPFDIALGSAGHQIAAGNRLRISICSAAFPYCDPNCNTGNEVATDTDSQIAQQTIFHDNLRPSHIVIPVLNHA